MPMTAYILTSGCGRGSGPAGGPPAGSLALCGLLADRAQHGRRAAQDHDELVAVALDRLEFDRQIELGADVHQHLEERVGRPHVEVDRVVLLEQLIRAL